MKNNLTLYKHASDIAGTFHRTVSGVLYSRFENKLVIGILDDKSVPFEKFVDSIVSIELELGMRATGILVLSRDDYFQIVESILNNEKKISLLNETEIQKNLGDLLKECAHKNASDIHITRIDYSAKIELRVDGELTFHSQIPAEKCDELMFVLYNVQAKTRDTTWNKLIQQSANIAYVFDDIPYRFRYEHFPVFGELEGNYHTVIRILKTGSDTSKRMDLLSMGLSNSEIASLENILSRPYGVYIIAGTTGSGKSTTLKYMMEWLQANRYDNKGCFLTVEDPVEYKINGAKQSSVLDGENGGFQSAIKSALRRDPDVLMVGEIRDIGSGIALSGAVESGHYCLSTVHAGSIIILVQRLLALGISVAKLSTPGFIAGLQCQRLVPIICDECKIASKLEMGTHSFSVFNKGRGCSKCSFTGIKGRKLIIEFIIPDKNILKSISTESWFDVYELWRAKRHSSPGISEGFDIQEKTFMHVLEGRVCKDWFIIEFGLINVSELEVLLEKI